MRSSETGKKKAEQLRAAIPPSIRLPHLKGGKRGHVTFIYF